MICQSLDPETNKATAAPNAPTNQDLNSDRYGRTVAELFDTNGNFLNAEMVKAGLAYHYQKYSGNCPHKQDIALAEKTAQKSKLGVWANDNNQPPWQWRRTVNSKQ